MATQTKDSFYLNFLQAVRSSSGSWYQNIQFLGKGGNGVTFLTVCTTGPFRGNHFALKVFYKLSAKDRRQRFLEEVRFLKKTYHPCIIKHFDEGIFGPDDDGYPFVVMSYMPNTLAEELKSNSFDIGKAFMYTTQLLSALKYLKDLTPQVIHMDIKPQNIFINGPSAILGDFGLIKILKEQQEQDQIDNDRQILMDSALPAMPFYYRTPELVAYSKGEGTLSVKSDIFQLGLVVAEMFTGKNPLKAAKDLLEPIEIEPLLHIPGFLGAPLSGVLKKMLELDSNNIPDVEWFLGVFLKLFEQYAAKKTDLEGKVL